MNQGFKVFQAKESKRSAQSWPDGPRLILVGATILWLVAVCFGLSVLWGYESTPGVSAQPPRAWPSDSSIPRAQGSATLVMMAHPHCPCTRASIGELASLMAHTEGHLKAYVLFLKPEALSDGWERTDLFESARSIPGVTALVDADGREAQRFHSATSGQTMLYDGEGRLLFTGGITGARGHSGDNAGRSAIESLVRTGAAEQSESLVFGCPLFNDGSECQGSKHESNSN
ncbi:MAG TPA: hypothetical protein VF544_16780 [Pyrinomonadaceae bacterium]|jgi:hypothetical protein